MIRKLFVVIITAFALTGCGPKDANIQTDVNAKLNANQATSGASATVEKGVATLTGVVDSEDAKAQGESMAKETKGVKSVINNITVTPPPPPPAPVIVAEDSTLQNGVRDATKDHPTVTATVQNGVITLTGSIERSKLQALMQTLNSLNPQRIDNNLTVK